MTGLLRAFLSTLAALVVIGLSSGEAFAHGGESDTPASAADLVEQTIALMVNTPDDHESVTHRLEEALEAEDTGGADMDLVAQAAEALDEGDMGRARELLEGAIGMGSMMQEDPSPTPDEEDAEPTPAPEESEPPLVLEEFRPSRSLDGGDWVLLAASAAAVAVGALLAWRFRPADTIRSLRRGARTGREE
ncbi:hypothetical protein L0U85_00915 [Glycomyces sp. L485]|uniref:hypothetical protein n=1 Tax=Glycomyces sp. L485 TaxID=2909235 RepID=UPI001F4A37B1|nr:hypothetical protein [Glycomyces sp. L485]MCH7229428.1 hypothetical protein [Glycomyces sp. L485]